MLLNPSPENYTPIPGRAFTGKQFKYILLNPSSPIIGEVSISALFYADDDSFFAGRSNGGCFVGIIEFDINQAGLLDAVEQYAITQFPGFISCNPPVPPIVQSDPV